MTTDPSPTPLTDAERDGLSHYFEVNRFTALTGTVERIVAAHVAAARADERERVGPFLTAHRYAVTRETVSCRCGWLHLRGEGATEAWETHVASALAQPADGAAK